MAQDNKRDRIQIYLNESEWEAFQGIKKLNPAYESIPDSILMRYIILDYYQLLQRKNQTEQGKEVSMILNIVSSMADHWSVQHVPNEKSMAFRYAQDYVNTKIKNAGRVRYDAPTQSQKDEILHVNSHKEAPKVEKIDTSTEEGYRRWKEIQREEEEKIARARKEREEQEKKKSMFDDDDDWLKDF